MNLGVALGFCHKDRGSLTQPQSWPLYNSWARLLCFLHCLSEIEAQRAPGCL